MFATLRTLAPLSLLLVTGVVAAQQDTHGDALPTHAVARLGTSRLRHGGAITSIAFAPDSKTFATTSADRTVSVWHVGSGRELMRCEGFERDPLAASFDKDGKMLTCISADGVARLFEVAKAQDKTRPAEGKELRQFSLKSDVVTAAAFSKDGSLVVVGDDQGLVRLWDVKARRMLTEIVLDGGVRCLALAHDGSRIATTSGITGIQHWDATTGKMIGAFGKGAYSALKFAPNPRELAAGTFDNEIQLFDTSRGARVKVFLAGKEVWPLSKNGVSCVAYSDNFDSLATGAGDGKVRLWRREGETVRLAHLFEDHSDRITAVVFSPDNDWLVSAAADNTLRIHDARKGQDRTPKDEPQAPLAGLALSPDGKLAVTIDTQARLGYWDAHSGKPVVSLGPVPGKAAVAGFTPDGKTLALAGSGHSFAFWNLAKRAARADWKVKEEDEDKKTLHTPAGLVFDGAGKRFAVSSSQGLYISVWEPASGKRVALFTASGGRRAGGLAFAPDGSLVASVGTEANVRLWDVAGNKEKTTLTGHSGGTLAVAFSPDSRLVASGGKDRMIRIWEVASGQQRQVLGGQPGWVRAVAFSPDGHVLATANTDGLVRLWDLATGKLLHELAGHRGGVIRLAFSAKGNVLASASADTTVLVWDAAKLLKERKPAALTLTDKELAKTWEQLASHDVALASAALQKLARSPAQALPHLQKHVKPLKQEQLTKCLRDLDSDQFEVRAAAAKELASAGRFAEPALKAVLQGKPSAEVRRSVEELLENLRDRGPSPEELRLLRSLEVLELIGGDEAKKLLAIVAAGAKDSELTRQAKAALERLTKRSP